MTEVCNICNRLLDDPKDPTTENCGGDCLRCMAEFAEDPDCVTPYIRILKTENKYLRHEVGAAKQELSDFKQEVSDAVEDYIMNRPTSLEQFIIPKPKPDPLVDAAKIMGYFNTAANAWAEDVYAVLDALGFEIREKNDALREVIIEECAMKVRECWLDGESYSEVEDMVRALKKQGK